MEQIGPDVSSEMDMSGSKCGRVREISRPAGRRATDLMRKRQNRESSPDAGGNVDK
jgi:hypothetical protein